jgi:DNA-binding transcriptional LysR family regulator
MRYPHIARSNLNLLCSFQVLVEERSITRAAERMFVSQPAMSRVLDKLQEMFHDKLLVRTRKGFEPTRLALNIYDELERTLPAIEGVLRGGEFSPADASDHFRIAMTDHLALSLLPKLIEVLAQKAPGVHLEISGWDYGSFRKLETNALDLVLWVNQAPSPLRIEEIYKDAFVCLVRKGHPVRKPITAKRYLEFEHLVISLVGTHQGVLEDTLSRLGYRRNARHIVPFFAAVGAIIENTNLVATLPCRLASFCRETQNNKSNQVFRGVSLRILFLTMMCVLWHIYTHEGHPIRISFRCLGLVSESGRKPRACRSWFAQLATLPLRS